MQVGPEICRLDLTCEGPPRNRKIGKKVATCVPETYKVFDIFKIRGSVEQIMAFKQNQSHVAKTHRTAVEKLPDGVDAPFELMSIENAPGILKTFAFLLVKDRGQYQRLIEDGLTSEELGQLRTKFDCVAKAAA